MAVKRNTIWAYIIGFGMALTAIHNIWLTNLVTGNGEVGFFIPAFGIAIWFIGSICYAIDNWGSLDWGDRRIYITLLVIVGTLGLSGAMIGNRITVPGISWTHMADSIQDRVSPFLMGLSLFAIYLTSRNLGVSIFRAFIPFVAVGTVIVSVLGILNPGVPEGGMISNYCASAGFLIFGCIINPGKWQWILLSIAFVGVFFIGALEGVFIVCVLVAVIILRRDISRRLVIIGGTLATLIVLWSVFGYIMPLYKGNDNLPMLYEVVVGERGISQDTIESVTTGRWWVIVNAIRNVNIVGHGYALHTTGGGVVHNVPLVIMDQIGPLAAVAWLFITIYCLVKTRWKYAWVTVLAMCVFDHYLWTQFTPYWWALVGVSTTPKITDDKIFK